MQPTGMVWTTLVELHLGIIPVKFGQNPMGGFRGEVVDGRTDSRSMDDRQWAITKAHLAHFVLRWADNQLLVVDILQTFW